MIKNNFTEHYFQVKTENKQYQLYYNKWGDSNNFPILCLHGLTRNSRDFDKIASLLASKGYYVLCLDIVGRGNSDYTNPSLYNYHNYAQDVLLFLKEQNIERLHWLGTSLGGIIAIIISSIKPYLIDHLILNDIGNFVPIEPMIKLSKYIDRNPEFNSFEQAVSHLKMMLKSFGIKNNDDWTHLTTHSFKVTNGKYYLKYDKDISIEFKKFIDHNPNGNDLRDIWQRSKFKKALILRGTDSNILLPNTIDDMLKSHDNLLVKEISDVGHTPSLTEEEHIDPIVKFLKTSAL